MPGLLDGLLTLNHPITRQLVVVGAGEAMRQVVQSMFIRPGEDPLEIQRAHVAEIRKLRGHLEGGGGPNPAAQPVAVPASSRAVTPTAKPAPEAAASNPARGAEPAAEPGSLYDSYMNVGEACIPCMRAHVIGVKGLLNEAARMAERNRDRWDQASEDKQSALWRVQKAAEELVTLARGDLTEEKIMASPPAQREVIYRYRGHLDHLRQKLLNDTTSPDDITRAAVAADKIYGGLYNDTKDMTFKAKDGVDPLETLMQQLGEVS